MKKRIFFFCLILLFSSLCFSQEQSDYPKYILYFPQALEKTKNSPLVVALSPSADAQSMINVWRPVADKFKWVIFASKEFKNGLDMTQSMKSIASSLEEVFAEFSVDKSKIILTGVSGGAMGAHAFVYTYPDLVNAIVVNTGMINNYYLDKKSSYPRYKLAVFLASPTDFRYNEMKRDRTILDSVGWMTKWIEFTGGHVLAPESVYLEAADWISEQWQKKSNADVKEIGTNFKPKTSSVDFSKFIIDGIIFNPKGESSVIINGEILKEGDRLGGLLIVKIHKDSVIVIADGEKGILKLR